MLYRYNTLYLNIIKWKKSIICVYLNLGIATFSIGIMVVSYTKNSENATIRFHDFKSVLFYLHITVKKIYICSFHSKNPLLIESVM